jgi:hypothetical protein
MTAIAPSSGRAAAMTVGAPDIALGYLGQQQGPTATDGDQTVDIGPLFTSHMIKF